MSSFQRMVAIPQEEYANHMQSAALQQVRQPMEQQLFKVEKQYYADENIRDPYRRLVMQSASLEEMKRLKENMRNSLSSSTPKPYRNRGLALLQNLDPFVRYNEKGEIYDGAETIAGSRLEDLINHAVRDRRRNITPVGWSRFLNILREHNIPKSILNRYTLDELEGEAVRPVIKKEKEEEGPPRKVMKVSRKRPASGGLPPPSRIPVREAKTKAIDFLRKFKDA